MTLVEKASALATEAHKGQVDKAGRKYIEHPAYVASKVTTNEEKATAWLHDVVEDTEITLSYLREDGFPDTVVDAVGTLTHLGGLSYDEYIRRIAKNPIARAVKIADLEHNMNLNRLSVVLDTDKKRVEKYRSALEYLCSYHATPVAVTLQSS
ncbi:MAG: GTP pyrophosphokinase [Tannerellaceae bacterium]